MMRVNCPGCGKLLQYDPGPAGKKIACPSCRNIFMVHPREETILTVEPLARPAEEEYTTVEPISRPPEEEILEVVPANARPTGPARLGQLFAREEGIDARESFEGQVASETEAKARLDEWRREMPETSSAYKPSGVLPAGAVLLMLVGSLVGGVASLLAGGLVALIGGGIVALIVFLLSLILIYGGVIFCIVPILGGLLALLTAIGTFVMVGWVSAWCTARFGQWGKNRNTRSAALFSVLSSATAIALALLLYYTIGKPLLAERGLIAYADAIALTTAGLGGIVAIVTAGAGAMERVEAAKFCEECQRYLTAAGHRTLCLGGLRALLRALACERLDAAASLLHGPSGSEGEVKLFCCPSCMRGYLEVTAKYKAQWKEKKDKKEKEQSWLAASRELAGTEVERLRPEFDD